MTNSDDSITNLPRVDFDKTETIGTTRWMRLETLSYHVPPEKDDNNDNNNNNNNTLRKWDRAVRTTKKSENSIDAVIILAILKNDADDPTKDEIVCVKQFRPPVDAYTIELPAGLIDADEDVASAATREFEEETGYVGEVASVSPNASYLSPGLTNESASLVRLEVDMTLDRNIRNHESRKLSDGLEGCEKDRGLEKLLLPRVGLLEALHGLQEEEGVKVFTALYSLALGMSVSETKRGSKTVNDTPHFPLVHLELEDDDRNHPTSATAHQVTSALRDTGFLVIQTPILPLDLQRRALKSASRFLASSSNSNVVTRHPSDPKTYAMLEGVNSIPDSSLMNGDLREWYEALRVTRDVLLRAIAMGLGMTSSSSPDDNDVPDHSPDYFVNLHNENNDAMRLLNYPPGDENTGNRCKEHSDYGTLTLLLTDGVGGLEAYVDGAWRAVPYVEGGVVVNIGSILGEWTRQELKATLHRVAGPASAGISSVSKEVLVGAVARTRTSIAYFADPNGDVSTALEQGRIGGENDDGSKGEVKDGNGMSVSDYIRWRSGGEGEARSGVAFTSTDASRLGNGRGETG